MSLLCFPAAPHNDTADCGVDQSLNLHERNVDAGYKMKLIMPSNMTEERRAAMAAYGAELINVPAGNMEMARDMALEMQAKPCLLISVLLLSEVQDGGGLGLRLWHLTLDE